MPALALRLVTLLSRSMVQVSSACFGGGPCGMLSDLDIAMIASELATPVCAQLSKSGTESARQPDLACQILGERTVKNA